MSHLILNDTSGSGNYRIVMGNGEVKWAGVVNGQVEIDVTGKMNQIIFQEGGQYTTTATTGWFYNVDTGASVTYNAYDGVETAQTVFYFCAYTFIIFYVIHMLAKFLTWKNTP